MPDWLMTWLGQFQGGVVSLLAAELRTGGLAAAGLAFALGALHALTPGHGKAALAAYFLGREAHIGKGLRVALSAALLHVLSGLLLFLVLRSIVGLMPSMTGRSSPTFTLVGYGLIVLSGVIMIVQSLRNDPTHSDGAHALTAGIGLLPCPLTISVLGFAWTQSSEFMIVITLVSLALGISLTIGVVALLAILVRRGIGVAAVGYLPGLERWSPVLQGVAGAVIVAIGLLTIAAAAR